MTHKLENNFVAQVLPQEREFWAPHQALQPEGLALGGGAPEHLTLKACRAWVQELHRTGGNRDSTLVGHTQVSCALGPRDSIGPWARHTCRPWRVFWGGGGQLWLTVGARTLLVEAPENIHWCELFQRLPSWHSDWSHPTVCSLQRWNASDQTASRWEHSPTYQQNSCLKLSWVHSRL